MQHPRSTSDRSPAAEPAAATGPDDHLSREQFTAWLQQGTLPPGTSPALVAEAIASIPAASSTESPTTAGASLPAPSGRVQVQSTAGPSNGADLGALFDPVLAGPLPMTPELEGVERISRMDAQALAHPTYAGSISPPAPRVNFVIGDLRIPVPGGFRTTLSPDPDYDPPPVDFHPLPPQPLQSGSTIITWPNFLKTNRLPVPAGAVITHLPPEIAAHTPGAGDPLVWRARIPRDAQIQYRIAPLPEGADPAIDPRLLELLRPTPEEQRVWRAQLPLPPLTRAALDAAAAQGDDAEVTALVRNYIGGVDPRTGLPNFSYLCHDRIGDLLIESSERAPANLGLLIGTLKLGHCSALSWFTAALMRGWGVPAWCTEDVPVSPAGDAFVSNSLHMRVAWAEHTGSLAFFDPSTVSSPRVGRIELERIDELEDLVLRNRSIAPELPKLAALARSFKGFSQPSGYLEAPGGGPLTERESRLARRFPAPPESLLAALPDESAARLLFSLIALRCHYRGPWTSSPDGAGYREEPVRAALGRLYELQRSRRSVPCLIDDLPEPEAHPGNGSPHPREASPGTLFRGTVDELTRRARLGELTATDHAAAHETLEHLMGSQRIGDYDLRHFDLRVLATHGSLVGVSPEAIRMCLLESDPYEVWRYGIDFPRMQGAIQRAYLEPSFRATLTREIGITETRLASSAREALEIGEYPRPVIRTPAPPHPGIRAELERTTRIFKIPAEESARLYTAFRRQLGRMDHSPIDHHAAATDGIRAYVPGDPLKYYAHKESARSDRDLIRLAPQREADPRQPIFILLDPALPYARPDITYPLVELLRALKQTGERPVLVGTSGSALALGDRWYQLSRGIAPLQTIATIYSPRGTERSTADASPWSAGRERIQSLFFVTASFHAAAQLHFLSGEAPHRPEVHPLIIGSPPYLCHPIVRPEWVEQGS